MEGSLTEIEDKRKAHTREVNSMVGKVLEKITKELNLKNISELHASNNFSNICKVLLEGDIGEYPFIVWGEVVEYIFSDIDCITDSKPLEVKKFTKILNCYKK